MMKRFYDFIKENKIDPDKLNTKKLTYQEFLQELIDSAKKDFSMTEKQAIELTLLYRDLLKDAYKKGLSAREALASTKRPGVIIEDDALEESYIFDIDSVYETYLHKIENEKKPENIKAYLSDYYNKFDESYSDKRIFERVKNNYKKLTQLSDKKIFEMNYSKDGNEIEIDVVGKNVGLIDDLIDAFSFVYKKIKERYLRPIKIKGKTLYDDIELEILLSNKDTVKIMYDNKEETEELKIYINGKLVYHMDYIDDLEIVQKASLLYEKYLERENFKINRKSNPFK